jgi:hypothetical protein
MSLRSRIAQLEKGIGADDRPKRVIIMTTEDRYGILQVTPDHLTLFIPWSDDYLAGRDGHPRDALRSEQRALIGPHDTVVSLCIPPNGRDCGNDPPGVQWLP